MYVVIFRAKIKSDNPEMDAMGERLRDMALTQFDCIEFVSMADGDEELSVSYWPDESSIKKWKQQADHIMAQKLGRTQWYESYAVEVAEVKRKYQSP